MTVCWYGRRFPGARPCRQRAVYGILLVNFKLMQLCPEHYDLIMTRRAVS